MKQLSMYLDETIHNDMKLVADKLDMSMTELIVTAFNEYKFNMDQIKKSQVVTFDDISIQLSVVRDKNYRADQVMNQYEVANVEKKSQKKSHSKIVSRKLQKSGKSEKSIKSPEDKKSIEEISNIAEPLDQTKSKSSRGGQSAKNNRKSNASKLTGALADFIGAEES